MSRQTDGTNNHESACFDKHHEHDKRITLVETELHLLKETSTENNAKLCMRQKEHEDNFDRTFTTLTQALVSIELKLETFLAGYAASKSSSNEMWNKLWPIGLAVLSAAMAYWFSKL